MRYHGINLNLLPLIEALLEEGSVSLAALRLNLSQPAVSNALAQLREHFQDELFVHVGRRMAPTELAQRLAPTIRDILRQSQAVIQERPGFDPASATRRFFVAVSDYEGAVFMPEVLRQVATISPRVSVSLRMTVSHAQLTFPQVGIILEHRQNDFVVLPDALGSPNHPREWMYGEAYLCIAWEGNTLLGNDLSLDQYLELTHVVAEFADSRSQSFDGTALGELGYVRKVGVAVEQFTLIPEYIVGTQRIATVHGRLAHLLARRYPLKIFALPVNLPPMSIIAQWNSIRELDPGVTWFLSQMRLAAKTLRIKGQHLRAPEN